MAIQLSSVLRFKIHIYTFIYLGRSKEKKSRRVEKTATNPGTCCGRLHFKPCAVIKIKLKFYKFLFILYFSWLSHIQQQKLNITLSFITEKYCEYLVLKNVFLRMCLNSICWDEIFVPLCHFTESCLLSLTVYLTEISHSVQRICSKVCATLERILHLNFKFLYFRVKWMRQGT